MGAVTMFFDEKPDLPHEVSSIIKRWNTTAVTVLVGKNGVPALDGTGVLKYGDNQIRVRYITTKYGCTNSGAYIVLEIRKETKSVLQRLLHTYDSDNYEGPKYN